MALIASVVSFLKELIPSLAKSLWFPFLLYFWVVPTLFPVPEPGKPFQPPDYFDFCLKTFLGIAFMAFATLVYIYVC
jgi:hypothetical protein